MLVRAGGLTLVDMENLPPVRHKTGLAFSVNGYGGLLRITLRYDSRAYTREFAQQLSDRFVGELRALSEWASPHVAR